MVVIKHSRSPRVSLVLQVLSVASDALFLEVGRLGGSDQLTTVSQRLLSEPPSALSHFVVRLHQRVQLRGKLGGGLTRRVTSRQGSCRYRVLF